MVYDRPLQPRLRTPRRTPTGLEREQKQAAEEQTSQRATLEERSTARVPAASPPPSTYCVACDAMSVLILEAAVSVRLIAAFLKRAADIGQPTLRSGRAVAAGQGGEGNCRERTQD